MYLSSFLISLCLYDRFLSEFIFLELGNTNLSATIKNISCYLKFLLTLKTNVRKKIKDH